LFNPLYVGSALYNLTNAEIVLILDRLSKKGEELLATI
jgi:hypothetical protein